MYCRAELADHFRALGVAPGDTIFLHASVRAVGEVAGGPDEIHLALSDAVTAAGTIMMYASCPDYFDEVGLGSLPADREREVMEKLPVFNPLTARSARDNGVLVEFLRTYPGTRVNDHVARFAARGGKADFLTESTPWDYAYGKGSPLERFLELDGKILLLGSDHDAVTFLHYVEHVADIADKRVVRFQVPVLRGGVRTWVAMEEFDTSEGAHANWPDRFFAQLVDGMLAASAFHRPGRVGDADAVLFRARELMDYALPIMRALASEQA